MFMFLILFFYAKCSYLDRGISVMSLSEMLSLPVWHTIHRKQISLYSISLSSGSDVVRLFAKSSAKSRTLTRAHTKTRSVFHWQKIVRRSIEIFQYPNLRTSSIAACFWIMPCHFWVVTLFASTCSTHADYSERTTTTLFNPKRTPTKSNSQAYFLSHAWTFFDDVINRVTHFLFIPSPVLAPPLILVETPPQS